MGGKLLICERDVLAMSAGAKLHLDQGTLITPSALDCAHERGIRIVRGGSAGGPSSGPKKDCLWHRILENDGTYVVQIVHGRATVSRLTESGPVAFGTDSVQEHNR